MVPPRPQWVARACDAAVHGGVITLLAFSPLAFGAVHAWSLALVQLVVAALIALWGIKLLVCGSTAAANDRLRRWSKPLVGFSVVALAQLIPLPPPLLRVVSPHTDALYREQLPGWPERTPFADLMETVTALQNSQAHPASLGPLPSVSATDAAEATAATVGPLIAHAGALAQRLPAAATWRPLSVYTYRSGETLLRMTVWSAVFFCSSATRGPSRTPVARRNSGPTDSSGASPSGSRSSPPSV